MRRHMSVKSFAVLGALVAFASCDSADVPTGPDQDITPTNGFAFAYGRWSPAGTDTCSKEIHDGYSTVGPDGKLYPTWHPPVDAMTGCKFGHEHGRDPRGSALWNDVGPNPFGYANEYLQAGGFNGIRHEDHVGHKIEWQNNMEMRLGGGGSAVFDVRCDVMTKLHQGTHSPDAFTNNLHEVVYHLRCSDGTGFSATLLTPIGTAGELVVVCDSDRRINAGAPNPITSPDGGGKRRLPEAACIQERIQAPLSRGDRPNFNSAVHESWEINGRLKTASGKTLVSFNPYYQVEDPSRFFDSGLDRLMGRPIDLCSLPGARDHSPCEGVPDGVTWDDPRSPFRGADRFVDINSNRVNNEDGPNSWYTNALGGNGQPLPFPGSIRQWVASIDNRALDLHGPVIGRNRNYTAPGVRAPN